MNQVDLYHIYRAIEILYELLEDYPEAFTDEAVDRVRVARELVDGLLKEQYKDGPT